MELTRELLLHRKQKCNSFIIPIWAAGSEALIQEGRRRAGKQQAIYSSMQPSGARGEMGSNNCTSAGNSQTTYFGVTVISHIIRQSQQEPAQAKRTHRAKVTAATKEYNTQRHLSKNEKENSKDYEKKDDLV
ncbi:hypothetical protein OUZ56_031111 [Daphnia magna]|uniref:Uncharacterized protein n=1 Tax=Daphnia magna TaxID=35525 RepID=A0ABQ9ZTF6_9CRUS|nr:hypothetical protein OUZ56_031111 [Daphnia magna]